MIVSYPLEMQNFTLEGHPQNMEDGTVATYYEYNATLPNEAIVTVSIFNLF